MLLFDLRLKDRRQQNDCDLMIGVSITCGYYFGAVHDSGVCDDLSLIRLNEPWSMDLVCRGSRDHRQYLWAGLITAVSLWPKRYLEVVHA